MIRRPPRSTQSRSSAASDVYKRQTTARAVAVGSPMSMKPAGKAVPTSATVRARPMWRSPTSRQRTTFEPDGSSAKQRLQLLYGRQTCDTALAHAVVATALATVLVRQGLEDAAC